MPEVITLKLYLDQRVPTMTVTMTPHFHLTELKPGAELPGGSGGS